MYGRFGTIFRDNYFVKKVNGKHFMVKFQGFGISEDVVLELDEKGVKFIIHEYTRKDGDKEHWLSTIKQYKESILRHTFNETDKQKFVPLKSMVKIDPNTFFSPV